MKYVTQLTLGTTLHCLFEERRLSERALVACQEQGLHTVGNLCAAATQPGGWRAMPGFPSAVIHEVGTVLADLWPDHHTEEPVKVVVRLPRTMPVDPSSEVGTVSAAPKPQYLPATASTFALRPK